MDENDNWRISLCDFGLCHIARGDDVDIRLRDFVGSPGFFAPEMVVEKSYCAEKADIFSCGVVLLEMILGHDRFYKVWMHAYEPELVKNSGAFAKAIKSSINSVKRLRGFSSELIDVLGNLLSDNSSERSPIQEILNHPWFDGADPSSTDRKTFLLSSCDSIESFLPSLIVKEISETEERADVRRNSLGTFPTLLDSLNIEGSVGRGGPTRPPTTTPSRLLDNCRKRFF